MENISVLSPLSTRIAAQSHFRTLRLPSPFQPRIEAIETLPETQRAVIELRDVLGFSSTEVCELLGVTEANQRVLLHRARSKARTALEAYVGGGGGH